ncbi:HD domain-containing protein [Treponema sp.]
MGNAQIHRDLLEISSVFTAASKQAYLVGGAVRDLLRGAESKDWDIATDASPEEVMRLFRRVIPTGIKHGTVTVLFKGRSIEVTTFRTESEYSDGRHPDGVSYAATIEEDLSRRDFTMNAIALELPSGKLVDPFGGQKDIQNRLIRCVGKATERFNEDGLRPLRAARFAAQLMFRLDSATLAAIPGALKKTALVSSERVRDELDKILGSPKPSIGFEVMEKTGLLELLLPELALCRGIEQKGYHRFDVLDHLLRACDAAPRDKQRIRLASLFHDLGKPAVQRLDESGVYTFYNHEVESEKLSRKIMERLRYSNAAIEEVAHLVAIHMFHYEDSWTDAAVRRFIVRVGEENLQSAYDLRRADMEGTTGSPPSPSSLLPLMDRVESVLAKGRALSLRDLAVKGNDLASLGIARGPRMGVILNELLEAVLDDPELNTREKLLEIAKNMSAKEGSKQDWDLERHKPS